MLNIIILVIGIFIIGSTLVYAEINLENADSLRDKEAILREKKRLKKIGIVGAALGLAVIIFSQSFIIIPTGYTGIRVMFGQVNEEAVPNGFNFKIPFVENIKKVNNKQRDISFEGEIWSETADRTAIYYDNVTITYQISAERSAWLYANVSNYNDSLVTQDLIASAIKTSSKTLEDADATNRGKIEPLAMENIQKSLDEKYKEGTVIVNKVIIADADFTETYNDAIAEKQNAQLEYEKQQIENQKNIETAEAEAEAKKIAAEGEKEANEILKLSLSDDIFTKMLLEKWDGQLPKVVGDSESIFDITSLLEDDADSLQQED